jgi:hypothetical protein
MLRSALGTVLAVRQVRVGALLIAVAALELWVGYRIQQSVQS